MNSKAIGGIIVGIAIIGIIITFASNSSQDITPDTIQPIQQQNTVDISDSATVSKNENTTKNYIIIASDSPMLGDK